MTRYILAHQQARDNAARAVREAPEGHVVTIKPPTRTLAQNSAIHPVIKEIAVEAERPTDEESLRVLRYLLLEQWRAETKRPPLFERSLDGMRLVDVSSGTSDLDKPDCSEFIDWLQAWKVMHSKETA
jgi:hypothetical protein